MVFPGVKVVTVPSEVVVVVVVWDETAFGSVVVVFSVVVVLVCAKASGAINAQARLRIVLFMVFPSFVFELPLPEIRVAGNVWTALEEGPSFQVGLTTDPAYSMAAGKIGGAP
jgi:hypothetical protein